MCSRMGELSGTHRASMTLWTVAQGNRHGGWAELRLFRGIDRAAVRIMGNRRVGRTQSQVHRRSQEVCLKNCIDVVSQISCPTPTH